MKEGRGKLTAKSDVTGTGVSGSRTSEIETERFSADVDDRIATKEPALAGR